MTAIVLQIRDYESKRAEQAHERRVKRLGAEAVAILDRVHYHDTAPSEYCAPEKDPA